MDPFERAEEENAMGYQRWYMERMFADRAGAAPMSAQWLQSFREFPPRQKPGSFNLDRVMEAVSAAGAATRVARRRCRGAASGQRGRPFASSRRQRDHGDRRGSRSRRRARARRLLALSRSAADAARAADPLPSWNDGPAKARIVGFVKAVTDTGSPDFVAPADRIAVFDNDGTLWAEQPMYFQLAFALDRIKALAPAHPEWKTTQPFQAALEGRREGAGGGGEKGLLELVMASHAGNTTDEFAAIVRDWLATARHPTLGRRYTELTYPPMLELLDYLRANGFKTYIVSGGGVEFLRVLSPSSSTACRRSRSSARASRRKYEVRDGKPVLVRLPEIDFIDDKAGKPVGIHKFIGRRPIAAFGNSDGDFEMLEYVTIGTGTAARRHRPPRRRRARVRLRPRLARRPAGARAGRGGQARLAGDRHEGRLAAGVPGRPLKPRPGQGCGRRAVERPHAPVLATPGPAVRRRAATRLARPAAEG